MTAIQHRAEGLPSIEKARELLAHCRSLQECMKIKAIATAVASVAAGELAGNEAAAIVLLAKARVGELTAALDKTSPAEKGRRAHQLVPLGNKLNKSTRLEEEGLTRKEAAECEKIHLLQESGDLDRIIAKSKSAPTTAGVLAFSKLDEPKRKEVLGKLGDVTDIRKAIGAVSAPRRPRPAPTDDEDHESAESSNTEPEIQDPLNWDRGDFLQNVLLQINAWSDEWLRHESDRAGLIAELRDNANLLEKRDE